jgi:ABC-type multidrug transport system ATPase subunit
MLKRLKDQGISILVSTPYMDEASLCDRIALIQNGNIMSLDTPQNIINSFPAKLYAVRSKDIYRLLKDFRSNPAVETCYAFGEFLHLTLNDNEDGIKTIDKLAAQYHAEDFEVRPITPLIEDSFIRLMQEKEKISVEK